ncbi:MAG: PAS domain S-box protein [Gaiellales bacterium]|nr:MAG: PAS domain S-box protein [Gaiellales bacterium]
MPAVMQGASGDRELSQMVTLTARSGSMLNAVKGVCIPGVAVMAALAGLGWVFDLRVLAAFHHDYLPMAPASAVLFIAMTVSLLMLELARPKGESTRYRLLVLPFACVILAVAVLRLAGVGWAGEFAAISRIPVSFQADWNMTYLTAAMFTVIAVALFLLAAGEEFGRRRLLQAGSLMSVPVIAVALSALTGYVHGGTLLYEGESMPQALTTAVTFLLAGVAITAVAGPDVWPASVMTGSGIRVRLTQVFLPLTIAIVLFSDMLAVATVDWSGAQPTIASSVAMAAFIIIVVAVVQLVSREVAVSIRQHEASKQKAEAKYRDLFEDSLDAVFIMDPDWRLVELNRAGVDFFGFSSKAALAKAQPSILDIFSDENAAGVFCGQLAGTGLIRDYEARMRCRDGGEVEVALTAVAESDGNNGVASYRGVIRDITEKRLLERQLVQAQKMESIGRLAGGVAHDFNNLLTAIQGYTELALMEMPLDSGVRADLVQVRESADRAAALTRQLLLFSRRQQMDLKTVNLNRTVAEMERMLARVVGEQYVISTRLDVDLWLAEADSVLMGQVLMNLVVNARDAMAGGGRITISTGNAIPGQDGALAAPLEAPGDHYVRLSVEDTGVGMDEETVGRIFEPFFSTKEQGQGTGLGLSVVYGIVSEHGGWVEVESVPGRGTTFDIYIPASQESQGGAREATAGDASEYFSGNDELVLLVEDEERVRRLAAETLARHGYRVVDVPDAEAAHDLFLLRGDEIDLLFTDIVLPGESGVALATRLVGLKPGLRVLLASGYSGEQLKEEFISSHDGAAFLQKPYRLGALLEQVRTLLDRGPDNG